MLKYEQFPKMNPGSSAAAAATLALTGCFFIPERGSNDRKGRVRGADRGLQITGREMRMRHIYIRGIIGLIWLAAAIVCGGSGNFPMMGLYLVLAGVFLYSACAAWKKEKDGKGGR